MNILRITLASIIANVIKQSAAFNMMEIVEEYSIIGDMMVNIDSLKNN